MSTVIRFLKNKLVLFTILLLITLFLSKWLTGAYFPSTTNENLWFYSGIFMVLVSSFFIEEYYTSPRNILANLLPLVVILVSVRQIFISNDHDWLWWVGFSYILIILLCAFLSIVLNDEDQSSSNIKNIISEICKNLATTFGKGRLVFSAMFLYFLLTFYSINNIRVLTLMLFWWFVIVVEPQKLINRLSIKKRIKDNSIGRIISVQSKKVFLVRLFQDSLKSKTFDLVRFKYAAQDDEVTVCYGFILETFLLDDQKWVKVLLTKKELNIELKRIVKRNIVYKIDVEESVQGIIDRFVGVVVEGSDIGKICFECYNSSKIQEGDLLEIELEDVKVYYQIIQGITQEENVERRNETGFIRGEAIQLGAWNHENCSFEKYGWVPDINSIVLLAETDNIEHPEIEYPEYILGTIPNTSLPVVINLDDAISHHFGILGVTGSGKSFITFEILKELQNNHKIICVDFTGDYLGKLNDLKLNPVPIMDDPKGLIIIEEMIAKKQAAVNAKTKDPETILNFKKDIQKKLNDYVLKFIEGDDKIGLFELPDLSNTSFVLEFTQFFLENVFNIAKNGIDEKICIVLEEAHTVVPETTFLGDLGDYGSNKAIVNKIGQIALQGRKYGVGLLVIAQRTANVSKTVLTQCNTILCFQAFDETSFSFIGNYLGKDMVTTLPNLMKYHAIVTGKGVKSNVPMIVDLTRKTEA
ncbi:ATP-binding protein [Flagellimonas sediminis]|uniref:DUF87 domain-containing protein n=1 Tax=Flagellimonas sediminis TaxID=2696468 RepID=A0A6I5KRX0_9FLAO|nr:DUF87 domain-containing protein [Allomuricauda sediminis]NDV43664.1 DUF87 domain-containing protein [Allomuricauda sediminis]